MILRYFRLTLREVLLSMAVVALGVALWRSQSELAPLRAEAKKLRDEAGYLTIDDADRLHAIQVINSDPLAWKWKLHLPDGKNYRLLSYVGELPPKGDLPGNRSGRFDLSGPHHKHRSDEPQPVWIAVQRDAEGELVLRQAFGGISTNGKLSDTQQASFVRFGMSGNQAGVYASTKAMAPGEPLVLLRQMRQAKPAPGESEPKPSGLLVWVEEIE